jgi:hypothetical protein
MGWRKRQPNYQSETWGVAETEGFEPSIRLYKRITV